MHKIGENKLYITSGMCYFIVETRNKRTNKMTTQEILNTRNEKGMIVMSNESANWFGLSRDGYHMITFGDDNKFYKNEKSWATRVSQLLRRGF